MKQIKNAQLLLRRINSNEALSEEELHDKNLKPNKWYPAISGKGSSIKISMSSNMLSDILDKKVFSSAHVFVYCILYYLLKIEQILTYHF